MSEWRLNNCTDGGGVMVRLCADPIVRSGPDEGKRKDCTEHCLGPTNTCKQVAYFRGRDAHEKAEAYLRRHNQNGALARGEAKAS